MEVKFKLPRLMDRELADAMVRIREELGLPKGANVMVDIPRIGGKQLPSKDQSPGDADLELLFELRSCVASRMALRHPDGHDMLIVQRQFEQPFDDAVVADQWIGSFSEQTKRQEAAHILIKLIALTRQHLRVSEVDSALHSDPDLSWKKYRTAQGVVLEHLQKTAQQIIVDVANKNAEIDKLRAERFESLESSLRAELASEREKLLAEHDARVSELAERKKAQEDKEAQFQTKEARYVSRQKQDEQIKQVQVWLENWNLTKGTTRKRWPIVACYTFGAAVTGVLALFATFHNYEIVSSADDLAKLQWWHWVALVVKSFFPLAVFTTFIVYFIRWSSAWAKQHSEEEFRNRSRLFDIGRSGWLLEAVRDAQEKNAEIPPDLLRELSRNLFADSVHPEIDTHPPHLADIVLQGLASLRVKTPDGSEIEASRNSSKK